MMIEEHAETILSHIKRMPDGYLENPENRESFKSYFLAWCRMVEQCVRLDEATAQHRKWLEEIKK